MESNGVGELRSLRVKEFKNLVSGRLMSKIERFEDIQAWQKARDLSEEIYVVEGYTTFLSDIPAFATSLSKSIM